ncbi:Uma2 family endonuclease [Roseimaritima ulvae]|uniref:Putative restriction endonuclease domain-containing protein n=1 Tax=Roseimaritima ulvae TaxID=980254 RepID=A0A5B9QR66_9BACT|nr:Uma2 family endonuclease [Roseimaritima ulvae]QEG41518.1 hypothetical protein UC8_35420 [Roseimaritima ulvae]
MSSAASYRPHYTLQDYRQWEGDWELWYGTAVAMTPSPFGRHGALVMRLGTALTNAIDDAKCDASVLAEVDWIVSENTVVRPDVTVVCGNPPVRHIESRPAVVVEVLSDATRERELSHKRSLYQDNQVPWYLIADPNDLFVQVLQLDDNNRYLPLPVGSSVEMTICNACKLSVDLSWLSR